MIDFKSFEKAYYSTQEENFFSEKLEHIAKVVDKEKCFSQGIEFFIDVNNRITENPYCHRYIGNIYRVQGEYQQSLQHLEKAIVMLEGATLRFEVLYELGMLYRDHNKLLEAKACFEEIIKSYPQSAMVQYSLSCLLIYQGSFYKGWEKHHHRIQNDEKMTELKQYFDLPEWANKSESHILILPEQGVGDKIMFAAYFSSLPNDRHYTVVVSTRLRSLFKASFPSLNIVEGTQKNIAQLKKNKFDAYCFIGCLPRILKLSVPDASAFLRPLPSLQERSVKNLRVGISWRGGIGIEREKRSMLLELWLPILKISDIHFVNLQYDTEKLEVDFFEFHGINIYTDETIDASTDFDAFGGLASDCDVVITVDNSIAHLAGALGVPTWVLLPHVPNWRWGEKGEKTYWYQSVQLFRQVQPRCWGDVIKKVNLQLVEMLAIKREKI